MFWLSLNPFLLGNAEEFWLFVPSGRGEWAYLPCDAAVCPTPETLASNPGLWPALWLGSHTPEISHPLLQKHLKPSVQINQLCLKNNSAHWVTTIGTAQSLYIFQIWHSSALPLTWRNRFNEGQSAEQYLDHTQACPWAHTGDPQGSSFRWLWWNQPCFASPPPSNAASGSQQSLF